ncbi:winged helix-turn-helix domain-containing protein [Pseudoalteromonas luteoviolacea]|uniref:OmpR/PhoB-type domain-containing protein n=1 Tax=Pseudoalteromonas luteoviolacea DSM 6061 TaxID=1365250 RepID=A0A166V0N7_9GAMM|nr:winged helix-turn-helix domain-containing protein [Pseudoalteromonas luteoviolacea]KZN31604.1 hypothetical protein N475_22910 [Pseudoalteromonas luteoviolacea DSM 6061]MBE0389760.1 hypothetical protein [Pseudoalteromonas luteoviolacea DSM 6061]
MRWKLGSFYFNANSNVLNKQEQEVLLEPKVADLLRYLCQNPQRAISRDELIEHVWLGHVVSDSAINRIVVKLRKALEDNGKIKRFVVTVPKVGYKLAVAAELLSAQPKPEEESLVDKNMPEREQSKNVKLPYVIVCLLSAFVFLLFITQRAEEPPTYSDAKVSPLLRLSTTQSQGAMSTDQRYLAFSAPNSLGNHQLHIQDNHNNLTHVVSPDDGNAHMPYWSDDGRHIFYAFYGKQDCEIHQLDIFESEVSKPKVIYQCADRQVRSVIHLPEEQKLLFVERVEAYAPWQVFSISLNSMTKRKVAQPIPIGKGNYYLDRDRKTNRILLLHEPTPSISQVFEMNIADSTYHSLVKLPYKVNSALWAYDLNSIVHPGEHPSFDLVATEITTGQQQVLYSDSRRIRDLNRINNGRDYLFTSYILNRDIQLDGEISVLSNSSVMDYLPAISNDGKLLAFISKRSGYSKLWLQQIGTNQLRSIELLDRGRLFYQLSWSFDDKRLLANTDKGIVIYDIEQLGVHKVIDLANTVAAVGWYSDEQIHYSEWQMQGWQANILDLNTSQHLPMDKTSAFVLANKIEGKMQYVYFDQNFAAKWQGNSVEISVCADVLRRYRVSWQFHNNLIYCRNTEKNAILAIDVEGRVTSMYHADYIPHHFSVSDEHWATWHISSYVSDLIRTNFNDGS